MKKDDAVDIAYNAGSMTLEQLIAAYAAFHDIVENTPDWMCGRDAPDITIKDYEHPAEYAGKSAAFQKSLHGAIGLATEAAEILDAHKKELYGKNKPLRPDNIREECGDVFFYLHLVMKAHGITLHDIIKDNVVKLANRYIDKFEV